MHTDKLLTVRGTRKAILSKIKVYIPQNKIVQLPLDCFGPFYCILKVHKHEIILNFFLTKIKSLYFLGIFSKKVSLLFLRFSPEFRSSNIFAVTEHTRNQIFLERYPKNFFFQNVHLCPIRWVPKRFFKIWILYSRNLHFNVEFLNNFRKLQ